jgi:hypothetical protein
MRYEPRLFVLCETEASIRVTFLDVLYWLPWEDNKDLDTQLRFGFP